MIALLESRRQMLCVELSVSAAKSFINRFFAKEGRQVKNQCARLFYHMLSIGFEVYFIRSICQQNIHDATIQLYSNQLSEIARGEKTPLGYINLIRRIEPLLVVRLLNAMVDAIEDWNTRSRDPVSLEIHYKKRWLSNYVTTPMQLMFDLCYFSICFDAICVNWEKNGAIDTFYSAAMYYFAYTTVFRIVPKVLQTIHYWRPSQAPSYAVNLYQTITSHLQSSFLQGVGLLFGARNFGQRYMDAPLLLDAGELLQYARLFLKDKLPSLDIVTSMITSYCPYVVTMYLAWLVRRIYADTRILNTKQILGYASVLLNEKKYDEVLVLLNGLNERHLLKHDESILCKFIRASAQLYQDPTCAKRVFDVVVKAMQDYHHTPGNRAIFLNCLELKIQAALQLQALVDVAEADKMKIALDICVDVDDLEQMISEPNPHALFYKSNALLCFFEVCKTIPLGQQSLEDIQFAKDQLKTMLKMQLEPDRRAQLKNLNCKSSNLI